MKSVYSEGNVEQDSDDEELEVTENRDMFRKNDNVFSEED